jgi:hypothetical protein
VAVGTRVPRARLPMGNPPSGVAAGYCLFDALALVLGPRLAGIAARRPAVPGRSAALPAAT